MSRNFVAFAVLALAGAALVVADPSYAAGGIRGGFRAGGGVRAPIVIPRAARPGGFIRTAPRAIAVPGAIRSSAIPGAGRPAAIPAAGRPAAIPHAGSSFIAPAARRAFRGPARITVAAPYFRLQRQRHGRHFGGFFPYTIGNDTSYFGTPYDPSEAIPVYAPPPAEDLDDIEAPQAPQRSFAPRISSTREENQDACRSERVTVPDSKGAGDREITVVRC